MEGRREIQKRRPRPFPDDVGSYCGDGGVHAVAVAVGDVGCKWHRTRTKTRIRAFWRIGPLCLCSLPIEYDSSKGSAR